MVKSYELTESQIPAPHPECLWRHRRRLHRAGIRVHAGDHRRDEARHTAGRTEKGTERECGREDGAKRGGDVPAEAGHKVAISTRSPCETVALHRNSDRGRRGDSRPSTKGTEAPKDLRHCRRRLLSSSKTARRSPAQRTRPEARRLSAS